MPTYRFRELEVPLQKKSEVRESLARALKIHPEEIFNLKVERFALDSRRRGEPHWSYNVKFDVDDSKAGKIKATGNHAKGLVEIPSEDPQDLDPLRNSIAMPGHIHIVGAGPSGLWGALHFLRRGFSVDLYEQGKPVEERFRDIRRFMIDRPFNPHSHVLYGEGGAGAFSDGKLNTRSRNSYSTQVLKDMVEFGVDESVVTFAKPHIGTDRLVLMLRKIRQEIARLGGRIHFNSCLEDLEISHSGSSEKQCRRVSGIKVNGEWKTCEALVLATGHSARDVYQLLHQQGVMLESKAFAMGVRVEHPQSLINERQLGRGVDIRLTGSAEYALTAQTLNKTSAAYSFCMCPGGVLVPCASEPGTLATNGMSYSKRNGKFANGAIVVPIPSSQKLFDGLTLQRQIEKNAYEAGGKKYSAPAQTIKNFLAKKSDKILPPSTYSCGVVPSNLWSWMDKKICSSLAEGFINFDKKIPGFIDKGLIVAPETRTSSPLRITRNNDTMESLNTQGLFVLGEGAGYAGGIVTSAADGVRLANRAKKENSSIP